MAKSRKPEDRESRHEVTFRMYRAHATRIDKLEEERTREKIRHDATIKELKATQTILDRIFKKLGK